jgi:hypothetical protein
LPSKYLLPCPCGERLAIEPRQAGETVVCACGQVLEVPTFLQLRQLEKMVLKEESPRTAWSLGQRLLLAGSAMILCWGIWAGYLLFFKGPPENPLSGRPPEVIRELVQKMTPLQTWHQWLIFRIRGIDPRQDWAKRNYLEKIASYKMLWIISAPVFCLGAAFIVSGIVVIRFQRRRRAAAARIPP